METCLRRIHKAPEGIVWLWIWPFVIGNCFLVSESKNLFTGTKVALFHSSLLRLESERWRLLLCVIACQTRVNSSSVSTKHAFIFVLFHVLVNRNWTFYRGNFDQQEGLSMAFSNGEHFGDGSKQLFVQSSSNVPREDGVYYSWCVHHRTAQRRSRNGKVYSFIIS
jgi:hypothetical protein